MGSPQGSSWAFGGSGPGAQATGTMSGTNKITGNPIMLERSHGVSWTMRWTSTPTGTFSVEVSNEHNPDNPSATADWTQYTLTIPAGVQPAGAYPAGGSGIDLAPTNFKWARLCYTNAASSGALTARQHAKGY